MRRCSGQGRHLLAAAVKSSGSLAFRHQLDAAWDWSEERWWLEQFSRLRRVYDFARKAVPYYRLRGDLYPPVPREAADVIDFLRLLPRLSKEEVRLHNAQFRPDSWRLPTTRHTTSGTSGTPLTIYGSVVERVKTDAVLASWYQRLLSTSARPRTVALSGFVRGLDEPIMRAGRSDEYFINIYQISSENRAAYASLLDSDEPTVIAGYASAIAELARVMNPLGEDARRSTVVIPTSEVCTQQHRDAMEAQISSLIYGQYGSQEGGHLALQCLEGKRYHVHPLFGFVDLEPSGLSQEIQEVVLTSHRRGMPLINYRLGDIAEQSTGICACGGTWPAVEGIEGRSEDLVVARDGRRIGYLLFHSTKALTSISEAQLVQRGIYDFQINVVDDGVAATRRENEAHIRSEIELRLGYPVNFEFQYLDSVPRYCSRGKFKAVIVQMSDPGV